MARTTNTHDTGSRTPSFNRRRFLQATGAASVAGLTGLAGCGAGGSNTLTYGLLNPMTGPYGGLGQEQRQGAELAITQAQESGDYDFDIEAVKADSEGDPTTATQKAEKLVSKDGADFLFGAVSSSVALALNSFAKENEIVYHAGGAADPITGAECNEWVFRCETSTSMIAGASAPWTINNLGSDVWFHIADYAYGDSVLATWTGEMQAADANYTKVGESRSKLGASNFETYISDIKNSDADVAVLGMTGGDLIKFLKQAKSQGLQEDVEVMTTTGSFAVIRNALGADADGVYSGTRYVPSITTGDNKAFVSAYESAYDESPDNFARVGYDSVRRTIAAAGEAGVDAASVKDWLAGQAQQSVFGEVPFRECDHQQVNPVWVGQNTWNGSEVEVDLITRMAGEDVIPSCDEVGCSL